MKEEIRTEKAPKAIGPYSQAVKVGNMVFVSGQIGIDPETGKFAGDTTALQTEHILRNIRTILEAAGCSLEYVVKTTVYLADMNDFAEMNASYAHFFGDGVKPARATIAVAALPRGARVEIEAIAVIPQEENE